MPDDSRIDAGGRGELHRFLRGDHQRVTGGIAGQLQRHTGAERPGVDDLFAVGLEQETRSVDSALVAADHRHKRSGLSAGLTSADPRIDDVDLRRGRFRGDFTNCLQGRRGVDRHHRAGTERSQGAVWTGEDIAHLLVIEDHDGNDVRTIGSIGSRRSNGCTWAAAASRADSSMS